MLTTKAWSGLLYCWCSHFWNGWMCPLQNCRYFISITKLLSWALVKVLLFQFFWLLYISRTVPACCHEWHFVQHDLHLQLVSILLLLQIFGEQHPMPGNCACIWCDGSWVPSQSTTPISQPLHSSSATIRGRNSLTLRYCSCREHIHGAQQRSAVPGVVQWQSGIMWVHWLAAEFYAM